MLGFRDLFNRRQRQIEKNYFDFFNGLLRFHEEEAKNPKPLSPFDYWLFKRWGLIGGAPYAGEE